MIREKVFIWTFPIYWRSLYLHLFKYSVEHCYFKCRSRYHKKMQDTIGTSVILIYLSCDNSFYVSIL